LHSDKPVLSTRAWLLETLGIALCMVAAIVLVNMYIDIYGIFRNAKGRHLPVYGDERVAKYLLSEKFVPENFDALLIGTSVSANWKTSDINDFRVYNESVDGGVIAEEKTIADNALLSSHIRLVLLLVQPYLTASDEFKTVQLTPRENVAALGSKSLLDAYRSKIAIKLHWEKQEFDDSGAQDFGDIPMKLNAHLQKLMAPGTEFSVDRAALTNYQAFVDELHSSNIPIIYIVPPVSQSIYTAKRDAFANYSRLILASRRKQDHVVDFTTDQFSAFRGNPANFRDGVHLTNEAAEQVVSVINNQLNMWIRDGQLSGQR
jgi:hypothetical protein